MLRLIGTSISYCELSERKIMIFSESHHGFQLPFYEIFTPTNDALVSPEEYDKLVLDYDSQPCSNAPSSLKKMTLKYVGSKEIGNRYIISALKENFSYKLELDEELLKKEKFSLTTGQRWPNPSLNGQNNKRSLPISGGWPTTLRSIKINDEIIAVAQGRMMEIGGEYIGVHYRNTDMKHDIRKIINSTSNAVNDSGIKNIFLATDDITSKSMFEEALPSCKIHSFSNIPDHKKLGQPSIHYMSNLALEKSGLSKKNQIMDALCDIICLQSSVIFIPSQTSAMSKLVTYLRDEKELCKNFLGNADAL